MGVRLKSGERAKRERAEMERLLTPEALARLDAAEGAWARRVLAARRAEKPTADDYRRALGRQEKAKP